MANNIIYGKFQLDDKVYPFFLCRLYNQPLHKLHMNLIVILLMFIISIILKVSLTTINIYSF